MLIILNVKTGSKLVPTTINVFAKQVTFDTEGVKVQFDSQTDKELLNAAGYQTHETDNSLQMKLGEFIDAINVIQNS